MASLNHIYQEFMFVYNEGQVEYVLYYINWLPVKILQDATTSCRFRVYPYTTQLVLRNRMTY